MIDLTWDPDIPENNDFLTVCVHKNEVFIDSQNNFYFTPEFLNENNIKIEEKNYLGKIQNKKVFMIDLKSHNSNGIRKTNLRNLITLINKDDFTILSRALEINNWKQKNKFCGNCGEKITDLTNDGFLECKNCGNIIYPQISPAIIVGIKKDNKILLAHNKRFINDTYSIIAGFVEWGESLEDTVKREVFEEVGIKIKNIKYFDSQTWPFPNSLMVGFTAEYESGEINPDGIEIEKADWFDKDNFPKMPGKGSIARRIIDSIM